MLDIILPQYGMGMSDGTITKWYKSEGEQVKKGEPLCEIEAAKTTVEMEAPDSGTLLRIIVSEGQNVPVTTVIAQIDTLAGASTASDQPTSDVPPPDTKLGDTTPAAAPAPIPASARGVQIEPRARRLAEELKLDVQTIRGTGPDSRVTVTDVQVAADAAKGARAAAVETPAPSPVTPAAPDPASSDYTEVPHSMMRKTIARRLTDSKQTVPHFYLKASCEIDALIALRAGINEGVESKVSLNDLVVCAVARALLEVPAANVAWSDTATRQYRDVDVAVAVATPRGLITPVVRNVNLKPVREIAEEIKDLALRARAGRLKPPEYQGGNVSVSNLGMFGIEEFSAILNPPQATIFAIGAGQERVVSHNRKIEVATVMMVTISVDHRVVDGAVAAQLLAAFKKLIENPARILI